MAEEPTPSDNRLAKDAVTGLPITQAANFTSDPDGSQRPVSEANPLPTTSGIGFGVDAGGLLRVSNRTPLFANKNLASRQQTRFSEVTSGGTETILHNYDSASCDLTVGTAATEFALRQSSRYITYDPGNGDITQLTYAPPPLKANQVLEIGRGDDNDGLFMGRDSLGIYFFIRTSTSGAPVDGAPIRQAAWNGDKLDGTGLSGITLDPETKQLFWVDFLWQGVGDIRFGFLIGGKFITCHTITNANVGPGVPFIRTPTLPVRYKIYNTGIVASASTLKELCIDVESEGGFSPPGREWSASHLVTARRAITARVPVFALRLKNAYNGEDVRRTFKFLDAVFSTTTNPAMFEIVHVHGVTADNGTWIDVDTVSSALEYSRDISSITAAAFHTVRHQYVGTTAGNKESVAILESDTIDEHSFISQNFDSTNSQMFAVYATSEAGTANVLSVINGREFG